MFKWPWVWVGKGGYLRFLHGSSDAVLAVQWAGNGAVSGGRTGDPGPAPHLPADWPTASPGRGLGRAPPTLYEARTSGIPREDSEVLSGVEFWVNPVGLGKLGLAYFRRGSVVNCPLRFYLCL